MKKGFLIKLAICGVAAALVGTVAISAMRHGNDGAGGTFFGQFVAAGGPIVWFVQIPLSIITIYLLIEQTLTIRRKRLVPEGIAREVLTCIRQYGLKHFSTRNARSTDLVSSAIGKAIAHGGSDIDEIQDGAAEAMQEEAMALLRKVDWHNVIGNISPMLGLFGTVIGMIQTFNEMGAANGQAHPSQLAHGISIAWVTTFWGLLVAIPALAAHGIFRNRIEAIVSEAAGQAQIVFTELKRGGTLPHAIHGGHAGLRVDSRAVHATGLAKTEQDNISASA